MRLTNNGAFGRPMNRPIPGLPVGQMLTYSVKAPRSTHTRPGTCEEAGCKAWGIGFHLTVPVGSDRIEHLKQFMRGELDGIKRLDARVDRDGSMVHVSFPPGTPCTRATRHRVSLQRPELYVVRGGDWRANTGVIRQHAKPEHWVEDFSQTLDKSRRAIYGRS